MVASQSVPMCACMHQYAKTNTNLFPSSPCCVLLFPRERSATFESKMAYGDPKFPVTDPAPGVGTVVSNFSALDLATVLAATAGSAAWCFKGGEI